MNAKRSNDNENKNENETQNDKTQNNNKKEQLAPGVSILQKYKLVSEGNYLNAAQNIQIDGIDIGIPKNLPSFIVASKNGGKSTLISSLISATKQNGTFSRVIYIYTDHVDSTLAETCHELLLRVSLGHSVKFISEFFAIKSEFMTWIKFIDYNVTAGNIDLNTGAKAGLNELLKTYTDNIVDNYVRNYLNTGNENHKPQHIERETNETKTAAARIYEHAREYVKKYAEPFKIMVEGIAYHIDGLRFDQFDLLIIDDVSASADLLFPTAIRKSPLYPFLTVSRHILLGTIIAGQDLQQLPKYARKEINTYLFGIGLDIEGIALTNIPKNKQREIIKEYNNLQKFEFIQFNGIENTVKKLIF